MTFLKTIISKILSLTFQAELKIKVWIPILFEFYLQKMAKLKILNEKITKDHLNFFLNSIKCNIVLFLQYPIKIAYSEWLSKFKIYIKF